MAAFLDLAGFKALTVIPDEDVDEVETRYPGWVDAQLEIETARLNGKLRKRYALTSPFPLIVKSWLTRVVTPLVYHKRGVDPTDGQFEDMVEDANRARDEVQEAANAEDGLYDLPLNEGSTETGVSKGFPMAYTEASPYAFADDQYARARVEDTGSGGGTIS